jgi:hypothetical protein
MREAVAVRARNRCEYCQSPQDFCPDSFQIEHIAPTAVGGTDTLENVAWACGSCNKAKAVATDSLDSETELNVPLFHPRQQKWEEHFAWDTTNDLMMSGLTPTGRATIQRLQLNRQRIINLRRLLKLDGKHPPLDTRPTDTTT